jgi:alkaline phosphatase
MRYHFEPVAAMNTVKNILTVLFISICIFACVPSAKYTAANLHSHNDYMNAIPFHRAYADHFGSIEADVFPVNSVLCVAHSKRDIQPQRTLKSLYLDPLLQELPSNSGQLKLLIDIKENYALSLQLLIREIEPFKRYMVGAGGNALLILISGTRPPPSEYKNYPSYIFFDDDLKLPHTAPEWERVGLVSLSFEKFSKWKGLTKLEKSDKKLLKHTIDSVHHAGKMIRFWAAPDNEASWKMQMKLGADLIGTDLIDTLAHFIVKRS